MGSWTRGPVDAGTRGREDASTRGCTDADIPSVQMCAWAGPGHRGQALLACPLVEARRFNEMDISRRDSSVEKRYTRVHINM